MALKSLRGKGWKAAIRDIERKAREGAHTRVGYLEGETSENDASLPLAQVAAWNEFGTKTAPARPFMRDTVANHKGEWAEKLAGIIKEYGYNTHQALDAMGAVIERQMGDQIAEGNYTKNSDITNLLKYRFPLNDYSTEDFLKAVRDVKNGKRAPEGTPLVWSGQLKNNIHHDVKDGPADD
ncbi:MAG: hypothetical protein SOH81_07935 [Acetobacter sp.]|jgi:hypothetical protein